ncbi:MAG: glycoside hydrolase family 2 protein, partial [Bacteroidota bacterium]|nr:glycoside hydrolase family 2 protein [Bacteroidota bacterium]
FGYGDRYCSGLLFWYHNCPERQVCARMWDWSLEPTASLYHTQNALEPLHPQFDYLKNTVSVYNDYLKAFRNYVVTAEVYDLNSKKVSSVSKKLEVIPEDGVLNNLLKLDFKQDITPVHFIRLRLLDDKGKEVASNFYWRSTDRYLGKTTNTGPAAGGFAPLNTMKTTGLNTKYRVIEDGQINKIEVMLKNTSNVIAFFTQIQLLDKEKEPVRPSFYTDNFFTLLPGESKDITIETAKKNTAINSCTLVVKGWNVKTMQYPL